MYPLHYIHFTNVFICFLKQTGTKDWRVPQPIFCKSLTPTIPRPLPLFTAEFPRLFYFAKKCVLNHQIS